MDVMPLNCAPKNVKMVNFMLHFLFIFLPQLKTKQTPTQPGFHSWFWHLRHNLASLKVSGWEGGSSEVPGPHQPLAVTWGWRSYPRSWPTAPPRESLPRNQFLQQECLTHFPSSWKSEEKCFTALNRVGDKISGSLNEGGGRAEVKNPRP